MPEIRLDDPDPAVLDGRHVRASAFETAQQELIATLPAPRAAAGTARHQAMTIGAGYARLPWLLAGAGYQVTAIDPSVEATDAARVQVAVDVDQDDALVEHRWRDRVCLPDADNSFDLVWCIDTLEIETDPRDTLAEIARVTRPGGTVVLDTVNNTFVSRAIYLGLFQRLPLTLIMPPDRYHRGRLMDPADLTVACQSTGIVVERIIGYEPRSAVSLLRAVLARRRGSARDDELGARAGFRLSAPGHTPPVTYYAVATPG